MSPTNLLHVQIAAEPEDALIPADFPNLEELDLHAGVRVR